MRSCFPTRRQEREIWQRNRRGAVSPQAEIEAMQPQVRKWQQPPETEEAKRDCLPSLWRKAGVSRPFDFGPLKLSLDFSPPEWWEEIPLFEATTFAVICYSSHGELTHWARCYIYPHFTDDETETYAISITQLWRQSWGVCTKETCPYFFYCTVREGLQDHSEDGTVTGLDLGLPGCQSSSFYSISLPSWLQQSLPSAQHNRLTEAPKWQTSPLPNKPPPIGTQCSISE